MATARCKDWGCERATMVGLMGSISLFRACEDAVSLDRRIKRLLLPPEPIAEVISFAQGAGDSVGSRANDPQPG